MRLLPPLPQPAARREPLPFRDRADAAEQLADALEAYRGRNPLILAIPRGGGPMAKIIADRLGGELDVVLVHKLGSPNSPEFAVGAVDESGWTYIAPNASNAGACGSYLKHERAAQLRALEQRRGLYTPSRASLDPARRIAIIVDDGMATGATMNAAVHAVRARAPSQLVCAVPVASPDALDLVRRSADHVACLQSPPDFRSVGQYYQRFPQVTDDEVAALLKDSRASAARHEAFFTSSAKTKGSSS